MAGFATAIVKHTLTVTKAGEWLQRDVRTPKDFNAASRSLGEDAVERERERERRRCASVEDDA